MAPVAASRATIVVLVGKVPVVILTSEPIFGGGDATIMVCRAAA